MRENGVRVTLSSLKFICVAMKPRVSMARLQLKLSYCMQILHFTECVFYSDNDRNMYCFSLYIISGELLFKLICLLLIAEGSL